MTSSSVHFEDRAILRLLVIKSRHATLTRKEKRLYNRFRNRYKGNKAYEKEINELLFRSRFIEMRLPESQRIDYEDISILIQAVDDEMFITKSGEAAIWNGELKSEFRLWRDKRRAFWLSLAALGVSVAALIVTVLSQWECFGF